MGNKCKSVAPVCSDVSGGVSDACPCACGVTTAATQTCTSGQLCTATNDADGQREASNYYRWEPGVGGWGGECTCPDGQTYQVGDNDDRCGSLACEGGTAGTCHQFSEPSRVGYKVTCKATCESKYGS